MGHCLQRLKKNNRKIRATETQASISEATVTKWSWSQLEPGFRACVAVRGMGGGKFLLGMVCTHPVIRASWDSDSMADIRCQQKRGVEKSSRPASAHTLPSFPSPSLPLSVVFFSQVFFVGRVVNFGERGHAFKTHYRCSYCSGIRLWNHLAALSLFHLALGNLKDTTNASLMMGCNCAHK